MIKNTFQQNENLLNLFKSIRLRKKTKKQRDLDAALLLTERKSVRSNQQ